MKFLNKLNKIVLTLATIVKVQTIFIILSKSEPLSINNQLNVNITVTTKEIIYAIGLEIDYWIIIVYLPKLIHLF